MSDQCCFTVFSIYYRHFHFIRTSQSVTNDDLTSGSDGVKTIHVRTIQMLQGIFPASRVKGVAVCHGRPCFHISLVQDISPNCDCHGENDAPILPDIGMFASFDPIALDQACADACLKAAPIANSQLGEHLAKPDWHCHHDHFKDSNPNIEWEATLDQGEKIGLGTRQYELKIVK